MSSLYFNNAFTRQPLPEAIAAMQPFLRDEFENPLTESEGAERARQILTESRSSVARLVRARSEEIFFVSSGTEANNWALKGSCWNKKKNHLIISAIEHFSVYQTAQFLQKQDFEITMVPVNRDGMVDPADLAAAITPSTVLVSIHAASDEIGVIQNFPAIARLKERFSDVIFHADAIQLLCYEELDLQRNPFDLVSITSNALYGPPGVAALYIREGTRILPLLHGGMQEDGLRPGLQSLALITGFGKAAEINQREKKGRKERVAGLQAKLFETFDALNIPVTGSRVCRLVDNVHGIVDVDGEAILTLLSGSGIRGSSGSTCYEYAQKESHVLRALGIKDTRGALLFTLGIDQTAEDIATLGGSLETALTHLRHLKP